MIFTQLKLQDAFVIEVEGSKDERGFFARTWCKKEFEANNLNINLVQANLAVTKKKGTLRGMHYQMAPYEESKLVRCTRGAIFDVIVDLRPDSATYKRWVGLELTADNHSMIYVPEGFAHGYEALTDDAEVFYQVSQFFSPEYERGVRYDDPAFKINWPITVQVISEKDKSWPDYSRVSTANDPISIQF